VGRRSPVSEDKVLLETRRFVMRSRRSSFCLRLFSVFSSAGMLFDTQGHSDCALLRGAGTHTAGIPARGLLTTPT